MKNRTISAENLGPISQLGFSLESPGVTVLVAPNGSGKTILLEAVQAAARGEGKLPLRDRTKRGKVEAFGAVITIGARCTPSGSFEVAHLEGKFDLAALVDPRIKSPSLADNARIKSLVSLTGVEAAVDLFRNHEAFQNFDRIVRAGSTATDDLVEMARKIKADYDEAARAAEDEAERETGHAAGLVSAKEIDLKTESDPKTLQQQYDTARDVVTKLRERAASAENVNAARREAADLIESLGSDALQSERNELFDSFQKMSEESAENLKLIDELTLRVAELKSRNNHLAESGKTAFARIESIDRQIVMVDSARKTLETGAIEEPSDEEIVAAHEAVEDAQRAVERGALIRQAKADQEKAAAHRKLSAAARDRAGKYRDAGKATDEVLSSCIKCQQLRVESDGKSARLVTDTGRGKSIAYHDLSDGEKWTIAIDIGADQVGEGGLLVISQVGWEGIDGKNRMLIHQHAKARGVYILTAEAASDPEADNSIVPTPFADMTADVA